MGDSREKAEVAEFWLTQNAYLRQVGQSEPRYVTASPEHPVKVRLPAKIMRKGELVDQPENRFLTKIKPEPPVDNHPGKGGRVAAQAADKVYGPKDRKSEEAKPGVRAADQ